MPGPLGLKLVSASCFWAAGLRLGTSDRRLVSDTCWPDLGTLGSELDLRCAGRGLLAAGWAGPEASRRHVRHASRRAEGLGLRLVSGWHTLRPVSECAKLTGLLDDLGARQTGLVAGVARHVRLIVGLGPVSDTFAKPALGWALGRRSAWAGLGLLDDLGPQTRQTGLVSVGGGGGRAKFWVGGGEKAKIFGEEI